MNVARYGEMFLLGLRNVWGYKLRSLLTMLSISFGIASVIAMFATGAGAQQEILAQIGRLGIRNIIVNSVKPPDAEQNATQTGTSFISRYGLTFQDAKQISATIPTAEAVLPSHTLLETAWEGSHQADVKIHGVRPEEMHLLKLNVVAGRNLTAVDDLTLARVCVVYPGLLRQLNYYGNPIGHFIQIGDDFYRIVGILADEEFTGLTKKALNVGSRSMEVYAPYDTVLNRSGTVNIVRKSGSFEATEIQLNQIVVQADSQADVLPTARMIQRVLEKFHTEHDYEMVVPLELLAQRKRAQQVFNVALIAIACISLIVGGIGIANIMLATITERTREIGVRRALGAKKRHVLLQFLLETVTLAAAGGVAGLLLGIGFLPLLKWWTGWAAVVPPAAIVMAIGISCIVGVLAGIWPASRAARMDPIGALRYE